MFERCFLAGYVLTNALKIFKGKIIVLFRKNPSLIPNNISELLALGSVHGDGLYFTGNWTWPVQVIS